MKILLLSFYFPPDLSAGSFRADALVQALTPQLPAQAEVHVLTTRPNRYASAELNAPQREQRGSVHIERIDLPAHQSGMLDQARAFVAYARGVRRHVAGQTYDLVIATSSRLMTAALGAYVAGRCGAPLYLDIRDIFVDTLKDVLPGWRGRLLLPAFDFLERWAVKRAAGLNVVSDGFKPYFLARYPGLQLDGFTNGVDDDFIAVDWGTEAPVNSSVKTVLYAGNIGEGQGLHRILPALAAAAGAQYRFLVIGDGGRRNDLLEALQTAGIDNVEWKPPVPRRELLQLYRQADVLFLHLNDYEAFAKVLPSKLFEYAATGKPVLAGVGGFAAGFARSEVSNAAVFAPCDAKAGHAALQALNIGWTDRSAFVQRFARTNIMREMAKRLLGFVAPSTQPVKERVSAH